MHAWKRPIMIPLAQVRNVRPTRLERRTKTGARITQFTQSFVVELPSTQCMICFIQHTVDTFKLSCGYVAGAALPRYRVTDVPAASFRVSYADRESPSSGGFHAYAGDASRLRRGDGCAPLAQEEGVLLCGEQCAHPDLPSSPHVLPAEACGPSGQGRFATGSFFDGAAVGATPDALFSPVRGAPAGSIHDQQRRRNRVGAVPEHRLLLHRLRGGAVSILQFAAARFGKRCVPCA
eukprot:286726-Pleurochrysis_carterae.AAC.1